jgi:hypothetical protein
VIMAAKLAAVYHALLNEFNPWPRLDVLGWQQPRPDRGESQREQPDSSTHLGGSTLAHIDVDRPTQNVSNVHPATTSSADCSSSSRPGDGMRSASRCAPTTRRRI